MSVSLNVENNYLKLVIGEIDKEILDLKFMTKIHVPTGIVLNGIITDVDGFKFLLKELKDQAYQVGFDLENVRLLILGSPALTKVKTLPKLKKAEMYRWMEGEFIEQNIEEKEMLYDYCTIENLGKEGQSVLLCALEKQIIKTYVDALHEVGISISCIDLGLTCQMKLFRNIEELQDKNYILMDLDGRSLSGVLYINNKFVAINRSRLLSETDGEEIANEVGETISRLNQYGYSSSLLDSNEVVDNIVFINFKDKDGNDLMPISEDYNSIRFTDVVDRHKDNHLFDFSLEDQIYTIANLVRE